MWSVKSRVEGLKLAWGGFVDSRKQRADRQRVESNELSRIGVALGWARSGFVESSE